MKSYYRTKSFKYLFNDLVPYLLILLDCFLFRRGQIDVSNYKQKYLWS
jgi:hypothetical protein